jgi:hypothetical protein
MASKLQSSQSAQEILQKMTCEHRIMPIRRYAAGRCRQTIEDEKQAKETVRRRALRQKTIWKINALQRPSPLRPASAPSFRWRRFFDAHNKISSYAGSKCSYNACIFNASKNPP